ncbi:MAG TPA: LysM peptidoglycan-binding domain-containing protein, partial [Bacillota bacterium]|nr:LysM peptidoglycan-binding domain-containing protein [Bacillota bacterium]
MFEDLSYEKEKEWLELTPEADDDIESIAFAFETTPESIAALNIGIDLYQLNPEQVVRIPRPPRRCPNGT